MPLKMQVILHHYMDFFETSGETLLSYSDEITEAMHSQIRLFEDAHRYINNKKGSSSHARMQHRSIHSKSEQIGGVYSSAQKQLAEKVRKWRRQKIATRLRKS